MPEECFTVKDLGATTAKMLDIQKGDTAELARSRVDANQVFIIRHLAE